MTTWTVVGLLDETTGDLHVAAVFQGAQRNMDRNFDAEISGRVLDQFTGYFDAEDPDEAAELARQVMKDPVSEPSAGSGVRGVKDVPLAGEML